MSKIIIITLMLFSFLNSIEAQNIKYINKNKRKVNLLNMRCNLFIDEVKDTNKVMRDLENYVYKSIDSIKNIYHFDLMPFNSKKIKNVYHFLFANGHSKEMEILANNSNIICEFITLEKPNTTKKDSISVKVTYREHTFENDNYKNWYKYQTFKDFVKYFETFFIPLHQLLAFKNKSDNLLNIVWKNNVLDKNTKKTAHEYFLFILHNKLCKMQNKYTINVIKEKVNNNDIILNTHLASTTEDYIFSFNFVGENLILTDQNGKPIKLKIEINKKDFDDQNFDKLIDFLEKTLGQLFYYN